MQVNPKWAEYNNAMNEGGEGYNPHPKYIATSATRPSSATRVVGGKARTKEQAIKFANNCLSGAQRESFLSQVAAAFAA